MARDLMWFDSGELALVGQQLGLGHPPGQPLYTLLLGLAGRLPFIPPLVAMNLLSALPAALCALPADALLRRLTSLAAPGRVLLLLAAGALAPVWDQASRIEVYALAALLLLVLLAVGLRAREVHPAAPGAWAVIGLLAGLLGAVNPVFAVAGLGTVILVAAPPLRRTGFRAAGRVGLATAAGGVLGSIPYLYVLLVRGRTDRLVWGDFGSLQGVWHYFSLADYGGTARHAHGAWGLTLLENLGTWAAWLLAQGSFAVVAVGLAGWLLSGPTRRRILLPAGLLAAGCAFSMSYGGYHPDVPDTNGYLTPALWLAPVGLGALLQRVRPRLALVLASALLLSTLLLGERPVWKRSLAGVRMPRELAAAWLEQAPPNGLLLVGSDHLVFPAMYLQQVEGLRPDVVLFNFGFGASSWYWRHLYGRHPELARISLRAPSTTVRLRRLLEAEPERPVVVEDLPLALELGGPSCPLPWGVGLGVSCASPATSPEGAADPFSRLMTRWWASPAGKDPISQRILARLARTRAVVHWAEGRPRQALQALLLGVQPDRAATLSVPDGLPLLPPGAPLPEPEPLVGDHLIGSPVGNLRLGAYLLAALGARAEAAQWWAAASPGR